ncbi:MAG: nucleotidyltransferase domain-containing protein [Candidatus Lokiarchaeota archaeon]|nr:nucleotidyltransferase domain-containing protein [Candidatus Lokiarchaeota archaeon]
MTVKNEALDLFGEMIATLRMRIELKAVILFGSRAKGTAREHSDYDIVIIGEFKENYIKRMEWVITIAPFVPLDLFCYTPAEFEAMFKAFKLTQIDAIGEGVVLFGDEWVQPYKERHAVLVEQGMRKSDFVLIPPTTT